MQFRCLRTLVYVILAFGAQKRRFVYIRFLRIGDCNVIVTNEYLCIAISVRGVHQHCNYCTDAGLAGVGDTPPTSCSTHGGAD